MPGLVDAIKHNPLFFLDAVLASLGGILVGVIGLVLARRRSRSAVSAGIAALVLGGVALVMGFAGYASTMRSTNTAAATPELTEQDRVRIREAGQIEAGYPLKVGGVAGLIPLLLGGLVLRRMRPQP